MGFCAHKWAGWDGGYPCPPLPPKLSCWASHIGHLCDPHRGRHMDCESYTRKLLKTGSSWWKLSSAWPQLATSCVKPHLLPQHSSCTLRVNIRLHPVGIPKTFTEFKTSCLPAREKSLQTVASLPPALEQSDLQLGGMPEVQILPQEGFCKPAATGDLLPKSYRTVTEHPISEHNKWGHLWQALQTMLHWSYLLSHRLERVFCTARHFEMS